MTETLVRVENLTKHFFLQKGLMSRLLKKEEEIVHAVDDVSFEIRKGDTFTLIGETGSGKTTLGKLILRLIEPTKGNIFFKGQNILSLHNEEMRRIRSDMQIIFQDPYASLNPRKTIREILSLPLSIHTGYSKEDKEDKVITLLEKVGLMPAEKVMDRHPHEFSGGQRQRIVIARALILNPTFIIADEPVASLDVSIRSQIINLLTDLKKDFSLTYLLIAHDLPVVRYMSDIVATMYLGKIVEMGRCDDYFSSPLHPYTHSLISAEPSFDPTIKRKRIKVEGEMPSPINPPNGCRFHTRCTYKLKKCEEIEPKLIEFQDGHFVSCHRSSELNL